MKAEDELTSSAILKHNHAMNSLFFWNDWKKPYKYLYLFLFSTLLISILLYFISYFVGIEAVINWELKSNYDNIKISVDQFSKNLFNYSIDTHNYLIREQYYASDIQINLFHSYLYLSLVMLGMIIALAVITRLDLAGFAVGMGIFIFYLVYLHTEFLEIFGSSSRKFALFSILVYGGVSFYFQAYDKRFSFVQRILIFAAITIAFAFVIGYGARVDHPFLYLTNYGIIIPVILSIIFIFSIAYDIIAGFLFITSGSKAGNKNTIIHFSIISSLYILNLLMIYLKKKGILTEDFIYIDVFIIYLASTLIGVWGLKKRAPLFTNIINVSNASFLYIAFAIISTATIGYTFITGNDALTETFQYAILYSHLGIGLVFFLYILYNFWELFYKNISAYEIMYKPRRMPYFMVRPLGLVIILSLFMQSGMNAYKLAKGGYYNYIGDIYFSEGKYKEAKEAYSEGSIYGSHNRRSNYCMGTVLTKLGEDNEAAEYYVKSLKKYPSEYAYVNLSNLFIDRDQFFQAFFSLKEGLNHFPESGQLNNNIAFLYSSKGIWDSTFIYLNEAKKHLKNNEGVSSNFLWLLAKKNLFEEGDSILATQNFKDHLAYQNNKIAILSQNKKEYDQKINEGFLKDSILDGSSFSYLYNYGTNKLNILDSTFINRIDNFLKLEENIDYFDDLRFLKCLNLYYSGEKAQAIQQLKDLTLSASTSYALYYHRILGTWAMEQGAYKLAAEHFKQTAANLVDSEAQLNYAIALFESGESEQALKILNLLKNTDEPKIKQVSDNLLLLFSTNDLTKISSWNELERFHFLHFRKQEMPLALTNDILNSFTTDKFKILAAADLMSYHMDNNNIQEAQNIWNASSTLINKKQVDENSLGEINFQYLRLLELTNDWKNLNSQASKIVLAKTYEPLRNYFLAVSEENSGKDKEAEKHYLATIKQAPHFPAGFIKIANFYTKKNDASKGYDILVGAISINENSPELYMAYALQSLKMNLTNYADESLDKIHELTSAKEFAAFKVIYDREKAIVEDQFK